MSSDPVLHVHPHCLMFFIDETGHETFADPKYPVFGLGGCAAMAAAINDVLKRPWRSMKRDFFGGADVPLHAADLRSPTQEQIQALDRFFRDNAFGRFAVTATSKTVLPAGFVPYQVLVAAIRKRWEEIASRARPAPREIAFIHEASERGDALVEKYFGETVIHIGGQPISSCNSKWRCLACSHTASVAQSA